MSESSLAVSSIKDGSYKWQVQAARKAMASSSGDGGSSRSFRVESFIRGYHVYQRIWNPEVGEVAVAVLEDGNTHDRYATAILEAETCCAVGHLPREILKECFYFLKMGGAIKVEVIGPRRRSDLSQGGLEVPCIMTLEHKDGNMIKKAKELLGKKGFAEVRNEESNSRSEKASPKKSRKRKAKAGTKGKNPKKSKK